MMNSLPDTLVTGATGLIGRWLVPELTRKKRNVLILMRNSAGRADSYRRWVDAHGGDASRLSFSELDLGVDDPDLTEIDKSAIRDVFHLAARYQFGLDREQAREVTVSGSLRLLRWCRSLPQLRRFVFVTGYLAARDADQIKGRPKPDQQKLIDRHYRKSGAYEASKVEENILLQRKAQNWGIPYTVINPSAIIGDSTNGETTQFIGPAELVRDLYFGKLPALVGGPDIFVPLAPVDYVSKFMALVPQFPETAGKSYWLLDQNTPNLPELVAIMGRHLGVSYPTKSVPKALVAALPKFLTGAEPEALTFLQTHRYRTASADDMATKMNLQMPDFEGSLVRWIDYLVSKQFGENGHSPVGQLRKVADANTFISGKVEDAEILLLHGMPIDGSSWYEVQSRLTMPTSSLDLPGHGRNGYAAPAPLMWMEALLAKNSKKPLLVAHSISCEFVVRYARLHHEKISGIVLVSPFFLQHPASAYLQIPWLASLLVKALGASKFVHLATGTQDEKTQWFKSAAASLARPGKRQFFAAEMARISKPASRQELQDLFANLSVPVTIVIGELDPLVKKSGPEIRTCVIAGAGHYPMISNPGDLARIIHQIKNSPTK